MAQYRGIYYFRQLENIFQIRQDDLLSPNKYVRYSLIHNWSRYFRSFVKQIWKQRIVESAAVVWCYKQAWTT